VEAGAGEEVVEDAMDDWRSDRVGHQAAKPLTDGGLARVWVGAGVVEHVAVRRSAAEVPALDRSLGCHGGPDPSLDATAFALAHPAVQGHHKIVGFGSGIDGAADLGDPQLHVVVGEHREREPELVAVEGTLWLADDHRFESPIWVAERLEEPG